MYKRILVAIDGSDVSNKALAAALQLARDASGQVRLIHVLDEWPYLGYDVFGANAAELIKIVRENGEAVLAGGLAMAHTAGVPVDSVMIDKLGARLGESVAAAAKSWEADLTVLGTHGRRGLGRLLLGSGAEQVLRLAPTAVLVVRGDEGEQGAA